jgi:effector-binding domain-containing protein
MVNEPQIVTRPEQPYAAIAVKVTMAELGSGIVPRLLDEVAAWLKEQGQVPAGPELIRYRVIDMERELEVEIGLPVARPLAGNGRVTTNVLPAGRYGTILYTGPYEGPGLVEANGALIQWARDRGVVWDNWQDERGDVFGSRVEHYLTDPEVEPDSSKWQTEVAIRLADEQRG